MRYLREIRLASPIIILAAALCCSCGAAKPAGENRSAANTADNDKTVPVSVTLGRSVAREVASVIVATGSLSADETSDIAPKVAGKIASVSVNVGQSVAQGSVIARIDDTNARIQLATANATLKQSLAAVRQAEARLGLSPNGSFSSSTIPEVRAANSSYQQALAEQKQAENNELRYKELVESGDVAAITYEQYRLVRDTARIKANNAKDLLDAAVNTAKQSNQAIATAQAAAESSRMLVVQAQQALTDTVIRAPFSGHISSRPAAVGEYVSSTSVVATILRTNPIKVQIQVAEADVPFVAVGRGVSLEVDAYKDRKFSGSVSAINPAVDPASRAAIVEARIENGNDALRSGMFATVRINKEGGTTSVFVPKTAVFSDQTTQSFRVFVIQDNVARLKVVQLGVEEGDTYQIISGVNADESVATSNLGQLYEGAKVTY
jgi:RND family efflux transporter MFP subunit